MAAAALIPRLCPSQDAMESCHRFGGGPCAPICRLDASALLHWLKAGGVPDEVCSLPLPEELLAAAANGPSR